MLLTGGRERTVPEYEALFEKAGLRLARTIPTQHPAMTVIEAVAAGNAAADRSMAFAPEATFDPAAARHSTSAATTRRAPRAITGSSRGHGNVS